LYKTFAFFEIKARSNLKQGLEFFFQFKSNHEEERFGL